MPVRTAGIDRIQKLAIEGERQAGKVREASALSNLAALTEQRTLQLMQQLAPIRAAATLRDVREKEAAQQAQQQGRAKAQADREKARSVDQALPQQPKNFSGRPDQGLGVDAADALLNAVSGGGVDQQNVNAQTVGEVGGGQSGAGALNLQTLGGLAGGAVGGDGSVSSQQARELGTTEEQLFGGREAFVATLVNQAARGLGRESPLIPTHARVQTTPEITVRSQLLNNRLAVFDRELDVAQFELDEFQDNETLRISQGNLRTRRDELQLNREVSEAQLEISRASARREMVGDIRDFLQDEAAAGNDRREALEFAELLWGPDFAALGGPEDFQANFQDLKDYFDRNPDSLGAQRQVFQVTLNNAVREQMRKDLDSTASRALTRAQTELIGEQTTEVATRNHATQLLLEDLNDPEDLEHFSFEALAGGSLIDGSVGATPRSRQILSQVAGIKLGDDGGIDPASASTVVSLATGIATEDEPGSPPQNAAEAALLQNTYLKRGYVFLTNVEKPSSGFTNLFFTQETTATTTVPTIMRLVDRAIEEAAAGAVRPPSAVELEKLNLGKLEDGTFVWQHELDDGIRNTNTMASQYLGNLHDVLMDRREEGLEAVWGPEGVARWDRTSEFWTNHIRERKGELGPERPPELSANQLSREADTLQTKLFTLRGEQRKRAENVIRELRSRIPAQREREDQAAEAERRARRAPFEEDRLVGDRIDRIQELLRLTPGQSPQAPRP